MFVGERTVHCNFRQTRQTRQVDMCLVIHWGYDGTLEVWQLFTLSLEPSLALHCRLTNCKGSCRVALWLPEQGKQGTQGTQDTQDL